MFDSRTDVLVKVLKFMRQKMSPHGGDWKILIIYINICILPPKHLGLLYSYLHLNWCLTWLSYAVLPLRVEAIFTLANFMSCNLADFTNDVLVLFACLFTGHVTQSKALMITPSGGLLWLLLYASRQYSKSALKIILSSSSSVTG